MADFFTPPAPSSTPVMSPVLPPAALPPGVADGAAWWNGLTASERERRLIALRAAGNVHASVADAWIEELQNRGARRSP